MEQVNPYQEIIGDDWSVILPSVQLAHTVPIEAKGKMDISWGKNPIFRVIAKIVKLPPEGIGVPTTLKISRTNEGIEWDRNFNGFRAVSLHRFSGNAVLETAGPFTYVITMKARGQAIEHAQLGLKLFGVSVPKWFGPAVVGAVLPGKDDRTWIVEVDIRFWLFGRMLTYRGEMTGQ